MRLIDADELCEKMRRMHRASATVEDIKSMRGFYGESVRRIGKWISKRGLLYCSECDAVGAEIYLSKEAAIELTRILAWIAQNSRKETECTTT